MNIYDLRRVVHVINHVSHSDGCNIHYVKAGTTNFIALSKAELFNELVAIGTYEDAMNDVEAFDDYRMSQWDALNISIRFELERETQKDIDNSDIGKAIYNLKNK